MSFTGTHEVYPVSAVCVYPSKPTQPFVLKLTYTRTSKTPDAGVDKVTRCVATQTHQACIYKDGTRSDNLKDGASALANGASISVSTTSVDKLEAFLQSTFSRYGELTVDWR